MQVFSARIFVEAFRCDYADSEELGIEHKVGVALIKRRIVRERNYTGYPVFSAGSFYLIAEREGVALHIEPVKSYIAVVFRHIAFEETYSVDLLTRLEKSYLASADRRNVLVEILVQLYAAGFYLGKKFFIGRFFYLFFSYFYFLIFFFFYLFFYFYFLLHFLLSLPFHLYYYL